MLYYILILIFKQFNIMSLQAIVKGDKCIDFYWSGPYTKEAIVFGLHGN